ncbi:trehalose-phosphatase [Desulfothermobacter acidiphilus]|uniref:trehalose-phosphatase n=1 Tax=Desulfothermobacter acidiphilus TaxID=1938353 RepID=UPI003F89FE35
MKDLLGRLRRFCPQLLLLLDYDGTLVPITATPDQARPDKALLKLLERVGHHYRVALVSGRKLSELRTFLPVPSIWGWAGCHGAEVQVAGQELWRYPLSPEEREGKELCYARLSRLIAGKKGFLLEDKGYALALHYRLADPAEAQEVKERAQAEVRSLLPSWTLCPGKQVLEALPAGLNKGEAVARLLAEAGEVFPVYCGDDTGDAPAFRLVEENQGISIGIGTQAPPSTFSLAGPEALRQLLAQLCPT